LVHLVVYGAPGNVERLQRLAQATGELGIEVRGRPCRGHDDRQQRSR
jgi:hypothetical protein